MTDEQAWHPLLPFVQSALNKMSYDQRKALLTAWLYWLRDRKTVAETALTAVGLPASLPSDLTPKPMPAFPPGLHHRIVDPVLRLVAGQPNTRTKPTEPDGTNLAFQGLFQPDFIAAAQGINAEFSAILLLQIRCLAEVYARWEVAATLAKSLVSTQSAKPPLNVKELVTRILTLFRIEGDGIIVPESDTLDTTLQQVPLPPGRSRLNVNLEPEIYAYCATYLVDQDLYNALFAPGPISPLADDTPISDDEPHGSPTGIDQDLPATAPV